MAEKHTPGPWRLDDQFNVIGRQVDERNSARDERVFGTFVATVEPTRSNSRHAYYAPGPEAPANAALIAAAPELLDALVDMFTYCPLSRRDEREAHMLDYIDALINKARGKSTAGRT